MSEKNDQWGAKPFIPWVLGIAGLLLLPEVWPLGAILLAIGVAMGVSAARE